MQTEHYMANMGSPAAREERSPQVPDDSAGPDRRAVATVLESGDPITSLARVQSQWKSPG